MEKSIYYFREIGKDIVLYGFMAFLSQLANVLLLPLLTRVLSSEQYGTIDIIAMLVSSLVIVITLALPSAFARYFKELHSTEEHKQLLSTLISFTACAGLIAVFCFLYAAEPLSIRFFSDAESAIYIRAGAWIALLKSLETIPQMTLRLKRKIIFFNIVILASTVLYVVLVLYFVLIRESGLIGVFWAQIISSAVSVIILLISIRGFFEFSISSKLLKKALWFSIPLFPATIVTFLNNQTDRVLLFYFLGLHGVAIFGASRKITYICELLLVIFRRAWYPHSMRMINSIERNEVVRRMLNYYASGFTIIGLIFFASCPEIFSLLLPEQYHHGYVVVPWLLGAAVLHQSAMFTNIGIVASGKTIGISLASSISVIVNILLSLILIRLFGLAGAAIGTFVAELVFTIILWNLTIKKTDIRFDKNTILISLIIFVATAIALLLVIKKADSGLVSISLRFGIVTVAVGLIGYHTFDKYSLGYLKKILKS